MNGFRKIREGIRNMKHQQAVMKKKTAAAINNKIYHW